MDDTAHLRRRYTIMFAIGLILLAGAIVLFFRSEDRLTSWLVVLGSLSLTMVSWHLRRGTSSRS